MSIHLRMWVEDILLGKNIHVLRCTYKSNRLRHRFGYELNSILQIEADCGFGLRLEGLFAGDALLEVGVRASDLTLGGDFARVEGFDLGLVGAFTVAGARRTDTPSFSMRIILGGRTVGTSASSSVSDDGADVAIFSGETSSIVGALVVAIDGAEVSSLSSLVGATVGDTVGGDKKEAVGDGLFGLTNGSFDGFGRRVGPPVGNLVSSILGPFFKVASKGLLDLGFNVTICDGSSGVSD